MRSIWRTVDRDIALVCLAVGVTSVSYGAVSVASGLPFWFPVVMGTLVLAGSSEFLFVGIVGAGGSPVAGALAGLLVNARHLPYGLALPDVLGRGWRRALGVHVMNDESVVFALTRKENAARSYWTSGIGVLVCWPLGALLGAALGSTVSDPNAFGLDAMFPVVILALILPSLRDRVARRPALLGAVIALVCAPLLPTGLPLLASLAALAAVPLLGGLGTSPSASADASPSADARPSAGPSAGTSGDAESERGRA
ncbi:branched-chain amino acid ABC transporter permease [Actinomadura logoneensis]|uniref:Branched-chain amino acid ABC transporter permease n=1 Tax=Actinomadura logoneensis TaxID=2293572 RepID=A0A372JN81_9ACTN|nr:AzlC family ABC transporter permease [Actinomadura logoneensis]RFU41472.1 branched-chain amino acid ABC transporter permease [Actinomadura logoneensis]